MQLSKWREDDTESEETNDKWVGYRCGQATASVPTESSPEGSVTGSNTG